MLVPFNTFSSLENAVDHKPAQCEVVAELVPSADSQLLVHLHSDPLLEIKVVVVIVQSTSIPVN